MEPNEKDNFNLTQKELENYDRFLKWLNDNGVIMDGVEFPAFTNDGKVRGMCASRDLLPHQTFLMIPHRLIISSKKLRENEIKLIYEKFPALFQDDEPGDCNTLYCYLLIEKLKGKESFYFPMFELIEHHNSPLSWTPDFISKIECIYAQEEILDYQNEFLNDYKNLEPVFLAFPELFGKLSIKEFRWAYEYVMTRSFGWKNAGSIIIPLGDFINHHYNENCAASMISIKCELNPSLNSKYYTKKACYNFNKLFELKGLKAVCNEKKAKLSKKLQYIYHKKNMLSKESQEKLESGLLNSNEENEMLYEIYAYEVKKNNKNLLWDLDTFQSSDSEDNDSDDEKTEEPFKNMSKSFKADEARAERVRAEYTKKEAERKMSEKNSKLKPEKTKVVVGNTKDEAKNANHTQKCNKKESKTLTKTSIQVIINEGYNGKVDDDDYYWYDYLDNEDTYIIISSTKNEIIPKGTHLYLAYGSRSNDYLFTCYGFVLPKNKFDSIHFHMYMDFKVNDIKSMDPSKLVIYKFISQNEFTSGVINYEGRELSIKKISKIYKAKRNGLCIDFLTYLRTFYLYTYFKNQQADIRTFPLAIPTDIDFEIYIFSQYLSTFIALLAKFPTSLVDTKEKLKNASLSPIEWAAYALSYEKKLICEKQIEFGKLCIEILDGLKKGENLNEIFTRPSKTVLEKNNIEIFERRIAILEYFRFYSVKIPGLKN